MSATLEPPFGAIAIVGMGLMGGSLGMALIERRLCPRVIALVRRQSAIAEVKRANAAHEATLDWSAAREASLVVLTPPIRATPAIVERLAPHLQCESLVTDVSSAKQFLMHEVPKRLPPGVEFIGGHPMAGSERSGIDAARADLYAGATWVLTRAPDTSLAHWQGLWTLIERLGARPVEMDAALHDAIAARISHLPHVAAAALASACAEHAPVEWLARLAAGGFGDTTRIAGSSPEMWRDICLANRAALEKCLDDFEGRLHDFRAALAREDAAALEALFASARDARARILAAREGDR